MNHDSPTCALRWIRLTAVLLLLLGLALPATGEEADPYVVTRISTGGGRMALLDGFSFWGTFAEAAHYGELDAHLQFYSKLRGGSLKTRLLMALSAELRLVSFEDSRAGPGQAVVGIGRLSFGTENPWILVRGGGWFGNVGLDEAFGGFVSFSARLGTPRRYVRIALFDQDGCYLSQCLLGAEGKWSFGPVGLLAGGSFGVVTGSRWYLQVPVLLGGPSIEIRPGFEVGVADLNGFTYGFSLSVAWRTPVVPRDEGG